LPKSAWVEEVTKRARTKQREAFLVMGMKLS